MKQSFDENFMADLQKEEEAFNDKVAKGLEYLFDGPEVVDDGKQERDDHEAECNYAPSEGF